MGISTAEYDVIAIVPENTEEYLDTTALEGDKYSYKISVYNAEGHSESDSCFTSVEKVLLPPDGLSGTVNNDNHVELSWADNSDMEEGYIIERKTDEEYMVIDPVDVNHTTFTDPNTFAGSTYYYRVKAYGNDLESEYCEEVSVTITIVGIEKLEGIPTEYTLYNNYPNPFNPTTVIRYGIPRKSEWHSDLHVTLKVYDILGNLVATLQDGPQAPGYYERTWNAGEISSGTGCASGIYLYVLNAGNHVESRKMILIK